ncbi:Y-family DNA polymerase [Lactiplantibacillus plantarum]|uniref:Y-family DNA polymerase n=1 Tax=Lactiplantibacillus plantarum TaxID=1590 RepID=UPI001C1F2C88|nr:Y-family DNA polymerase [Lactiplantibacillus plantarum]MBU7446273.1 Y-family DNA polymerase [Lactiplantibacillus plantarum]MBU7459400.1 Y-family DNA polymerase [Lactiplantibacillus plantarum]
MFFDQEPHGVFFLIDNKSFYASCEAVARGLNPLKVPLVVLSEAKNTNGGLILATSPEAKQLFHLKANVSRKRDLPNDPRLWVVPPRMNLYIQRNLQINQIFHQFASEKEVWPYSIDESILDMTHSWRLFGNSIREVARLIQKKIRQQIGLYTTVGIGDNPVQAKLALDNYAKHNHELIGEIHYETVPDKIWSINELTDVWGIGPRMAKRLNRLQIHNMYELAHTNPYLLQQNLGVIGSQLFATAWGVDRTKLTEPIKTKEASLGNSQVLPRDYLTQNEIETVIKEIGEQVAARLRHHHKLAGCLSLSVGFSYAAAETDGRNGFHQALKIEPTNNDQTLTQQLLWLFRKNWDGQAVRNIGVYSSKLSPDAGQQLNLFESPLNQIQHSKLNQVIDEIHRRFGFTKLVYATSLLPGGTAIERAALVGGHNGGNSYE